VDTKDILISVGTFILGFFAEKILDFLLSKVKKVYNEKSDKRIRHYNAIISSDDFIAFQNYVLKNYYGEKYLTTTLGYTYSAHAFPGYASPECKKALFDTMCDKNELDTNHQPIDFTQSKYYKEYQKLVGKNIRRPKMQGFMLNELKFNPEHKVVGFSSWVGTYDQNVYTSHILEYEIYKAYKKYGKVYKNNDQIWPKIKDSLTLRNAIHKDKTIDEVLYTGCNRASLLGVQMLIVLKNRETKEYEAISIKRSEAVAARPGYIQFIPSGGFEVFENSDEHDSIELEENYSIFNAVFREYVEELFGLEDYESGHGGETIRKLRNDPRVMTITDMLAKGTAKMEFLGGCIDLTGLRTELSFALVISDEEYSKVIFKSNEESKKISRTSIEKIAKEHAKFDVKKINPTSAALWHLFEISPVYNELFNNK
jgi:hypothetical protein